MGWQTTRHPNKSIHYIDVFIQLFLRNKYILIFFSELWYNCSYRGDEQLNEEIEEAHNLSDGIKWISVDKMLPIRPDYDWVLVKCQMVPEGYEGIPHVAELRNDIWYADLLDEPMEEHLGVKVTHWADMQQIPE